MKDGQIGTIIAWAKETKKLRGLQVQRIKNSLFLSGAVWEDVFHPKSFLNKDGYKIQLIETHEKRS